MATVAKTISHQGYAVSLSLPTPDSVFFCGIVIGLARAWTLLGCNELPGPFQPRPRRYPEGENTIRAKVVEKEKKKTQNSLIPLSLGDSMIHHEPLLKYICPFHSK